MEDRMRKLIVVAAVCVAAAGCGGGGSSPTAAPTPTPPPPLRDGTVVLNGTVGGTFTLSSSPAQLSGGRLFGCGEAKVTIPYRETAGGEATGGDYEVKILEHNDDFARRGTGKATNIVIDANESGTISITEGSVCVEYKPSVPPRGSVVINFGGAATGRVSQIVGVGPLTVN
jgi:hypothetical protein